MALVWAPGVLTGVFLSFLLYLGSLPTPDGTAQEQAGGPQAAAQPPKPRFDFYTMLPGQTTDVEVEPAPEVVKPRSSNAPERILPVADRDLFGSGKMRTGAGQSYCYLGLTPMVEESNGDNGRWYRVYVGPFESHAKMARARSLTANQNIDTLLLKRSRP